MTRAWALIPLVATLSALAGCATNPAPTPSSRPQSVDAGPVLGAADLTEAGAAPKLVVRWLASCASGEQPVFFSVALSSDGDARYVGGVQAREVGERHSRVNRSEVVRLVSQARAVLHPVPVRQPEVPAATRPDVCIEIVIDSARASRQSVESRSVTSFVRELVRAVPLRKWVCPNRENLDEPRLTFGDFCGKWQRPSAIDADFFDAGNCVSHHTVSIYDDGTVYYAAHARTTRNGSSDRIFSDAYYTLNHADYERLMKLAASFQLRNDELVEDPPPSPRRPNLSPYSGSNPSELAQFRQEVQASAGIRWVELPAPDAPCLPGLGASSLWMRADVRQALRELTAAVTNEAVRER